MTIDGDQADGTGRDVAALTGDLVGARSSDAERGSPLRRVAVLKDALQALMAECGSAIVSEFQVFRGDSFQGIVIPEEAFRVAMMLRAFLRSRSPVRAASSALDARIAVGIGDVSEIPSAGVAESDGTAMRRSGSLLDRMKRSGHRLVFATPWPSFDAEVNVECGLLDIVVGRWSKPQSEAILLCQLYGRTQKDAANELGVSQPAIAQRLAAAHADAVDMVFHRYQSLLARTMKQQHRPSTGSNLVS
jgi:hypothetical protein